MKVSYRWLQDYIDIPWSAQELANRLTMAGLEVESVERIAPDLSQVYVGEVLEVTPHPNAALNVCQICIGDKTLTIVCGAPNVRVGIKVPVAVEGATLPNNMQIGVANLRGVTSYGMACSEAELGLGDDDGGLMELSDETKAGQTLSAALGLDDLVLDVSIYANRPDCMSMLGIAREVAALLGQTIRYPELTLTELTKPTNELTSITVEDGTKCPRYSARVIENIHITASPLWMQQKLRAAGMRPINNVVDITNFVMLETGQPLHAFDYGKLAENRIVVRLARENEQFVTLDGVKRNLVSEMLMICDANQPVCIAGVMGGENSEVSNETQTILLEAASFAAINVRRTSRKLGIFSEAAARFEKGMDPEGTVYALNRAAWLLAKYAGGDIAAGVIDIRNGQAGTKRVQLRPTKVNQLLGTTIGEQEMKDILNSLELVVDNQVSPWQITIPSFRQDIELECDLIEEIARHWGFAKVPVTLPSGANAQGGQSRMQSLMDELRRSLVGGGLSEAINYTFVNPKGVTQIGLGDQEPYNLMIPLQNPLTEDHAVMRTTLLPSLLDSAQRNLSRQQDRINFFEVGSVYLPESLPLKEQPQEELRLGLLLFGARKQRHFSTQVEYYDFYDIKGYVETVLAHFSADFVHETGEFLPLHPGRQGQVRVGEQVVAHYGELHPDVQKAYKIPDRTYVAEIDLHALLAYPKKLPLFQQLPRFPAVERDIALILDQTVPVADVVDTLRDKGGVLLTKIGVFDVYAGKQVPEGKKSVAFSFVFQANQTLTDEEVAQQLELMYKGVQEKFNADIR